MVVSLKSTLATLLAVAQSVQALPPSSRAAAARRDMSLMDDRPNLPHDPNTEPSCTWWWDNDGSIACRDMPFEWGISMEDFLKWNPSITPECGNYITGRSYCVEAPSSGPPPVTTTGPTTTTTGPPSTTTAPGNGIETPRPTQPGMVNDCDRFYFVRQDDSCAAIALQHGISQQQFQQWNPTVGATCSGIWANVYVCVRTIGFQPPTTTTTSTSTTTTTPDNGIETPQPTQPGMVSNCNKFYLVKPDESCTVIASSNGVSQQQLVTWNPSIGSTCSGLWANVYLCVGVVGMTTTTTRPTTTTTTPTTTTRPGNGISTPTPTQPGMVSNCNSFHLVRSGDSCASIGARYGVRASRISDWNTSVGPSCSGLWANTNVCVRTIGFTPSTSVTCHTATDHKTWGGNKPAALNSVVQWCNGDSSTDGSGGFATAQIKRGCYNAPNGENKIEFVARNDFGSGASLSVAKCNEIMKAGVDRCDRGGTGSQEGWWFSSRIVAGRC